MKYYEITCGNCLHVFKIQLTPDDTIHICPHCHSAIEFDDVEWEDGEDIDFES